MNEYKEIVLNIARLLSSVECRDSYSLQIALTIENILETAEYLSKENILFLKQSCNKLVASDKLGKAVLKIINKDFDYLLSVDVSKSGGYIID